MALADLSAFLAGEDHEYSYAGAEISLKDINVLPQPRKTFGNLDELSLDIKRKGILNPPTVALFGQEEAERYINVINFLWKTKFDIGDLLGVRVGEEILYYVLLAGERRVRASRLLWNKRPRKKISVRLCKNIPPLAALFLQFSENTHMRVPPHEEAYAYSELFKLIREMDSKYPLARFARQVGRGPETIKKAIRFCELPRSIQESVEKELVSYGIAVQIARLHERGESTEQLDWWLLRAVTENYNVRDFRQLVTQYIRHKESGQGSLLDLMTDNQRAELEKPHFRSVVGKNILQATWTWISYVKLVLTLFEEGKLGKEDSFYSEKSPLRVHIELIGIQERLLPHLVGLLSEKDLEETQVLLAKVRMVAEILYKKPS